MLYICILQKLHDCFVLILCRCPLVYLQVQSLRSATSCDFLPKEAVIAVIRSLGSSSNYPVADDFDSAKALSMLAFLGQAHPQSNAMSVLMLLLCYLCSVHLGGRNNAQSLARRTKSFHLAQHLLSQSLRRRAIPWSYRMFGIAVGAIQGVT